MRALRLAAALTGLGALLTCGSAAALRLPEPPAEEAPVTERSADALALLERAAAAAQARAWTGTERVLSLVTGAPVVTVTTVAHGPGRHSASDALDARLFSLLATHYDLRITGTALCGGRHARVVEARRPGRAGLVAARFWLDVTSGLLLRRDVLDLTGQLLRRSELVDVRTGAAPATVAAPRVVETRGQHLDALALAEKESAGWPVLRVLPGHLDLYDARWLEDGVLQLAYSDGLSTLSLFVQDGERPPGGDAVLRRVSGGDVWEMPGEPERAVWVADGRTWTLVSDVAPALADEVLQALPHTPSAGTDDGVAPRVWRGLSRVGAWLNPFA